MELAICSQFPQPGRILVNCLSRLLHCLAKLKDFEVDVFLGQEIYTHLAFLELSCSPLLFPGECRIFLVFVDQLGREGVLAFVYHR